MLPDRIDLRWSLYDYVVAPFLFYFWTWLIIIRHGIVTSIEAEVVVWTEWRAGYYWLHMSGVLVGKVMKSCVELADPLFPPAILDKQLQVATVWRRVGRVGGFPRNSAAVALNSSPPVQQQSSTNPKSNRKRQTRQRQQQRRVCLEAPDPILSGRLSNKGQASLSLL